MAQDGDRAERGAPGSDPTGADQRIGADHAEQEPADVSGKRHAASALLGLRSAYLASRNWKRNQAPR